MADVSERRTARRFSMALPLTVRSSGEQGILEHQAHTRDVSFRGLYFTLPQCDLEPASQIEFVLTLPKETTLSGDVHIRCQGRVVRVEPDGLTKGVAAYIETYEFLPLGSAVPSAVDGKPRTSTASPKDIQ